MLTWAYPDFTLLAGAAALALLLLLAYWLRLRRLGRALGQGIGRLAWKLPLRLLIGLCLGAALLGPALGVSRQPVLTTGKDLWLVVDLSRSMDAADVAPSRLFRAQAELAKLVTAFPADRLGLVVFGSSAYVQCPLTFDQNALLVFISTLRTSLLPPGPTRLREPLQLLLDRLGRTPAAPRSTSIILVSDGEDFGENLEPVLRSLARSGTRLYTVGVGTAAGATIPQGGGRLLRNAKGQPVQTRLQEAPLLQLAAQTGGLFVELNDQQNGLPRLLSALRNAPAPTEQIRTVALADNRYRYPLTLAIILLALDVLLTITILKP